MTQSESQESFASFAATTGERVRRALVAAYGVEIGNEATSEAMSVAWERWSEVAGMENAAGFLYRVGQSKARPHLRWARRASSSFPALHPAVPTTDAAVLDVLEALRGLSRAQRVAVLLTKSYGLSYREVADLLQTTETAVTNHVHRGVQRLRSMLESTDDDR